MKKLVSLLMSLMMVMLLAAPVATAQAEDLPKDVTVRVYSWWDPTKPGMVNLKAGF